MKEKFAVPLRLILVLIVLMVLFGACAPLTNSPSPTPTATPTPVEHTVHTIRVNVEYVYHPGVLNFFQRHGVELPINSFSTLEEIYVFEDGVSIKNIHPLRFSEWEEAGVNLFKFRPMPGETFAVGGCEFYPIFEQTMYFPREMDCTPSSGVSNSASETFHMKVKVEMVYCSPVGKSTLVCKTGGLIVSLGGSWMQFWVDPNDPSLPHSLPLYEQLVNEVALFLGLYDPEVEEPIHVVPGWGTGIVKPPPSWNR